MKWKYKLNVWMWIKEIMWVMTKNKNEKNMVRQSKKKNKANLKR